jgi:hypothetical protein
MQSLPIKELGKCIYDSSLVEEDANADGIEKKELKETVKEFYFSNTELQINIKNTLISFIRDNKDLIVVGPVSDVTTPPPNA